MNVFVYHAQDHEGTLLAELIRNSDPEEGFQFLPIESPHSVNRLYQCLRNHNIAPEKVTLPIVILVHTADRRTILYGERYQNWLASVVNMVVETESGRDMVRRSVLPHLSPATLHLIAATLAGPALPTAVDEEEAVAEIEEAPMQTQPPTPSVNVEEDEETGVSWASVPERRHTKPVNVAQSMAEGKQREGQNLKPYSR